jgi:MATE family multidrug resistance protein
MLDPDTVPEVHGFRQELSAMVGLALPIVLVQVGQMFMGVVDALMVGHVSAEALAAAALGNLYFYVIAIFGIGTLLALDPIVSQAVGADDRPAIARAMQRGLLLAVVLTLVSSPLMLVAEPALRALRQTPSVAAAAASYTRAIMPGMLPFYVFVVFRQTLQAHRRVAPVVIAIVAANLANAGLNWVLVFGHLGFAALGVVGSGHATAISRWLMPLVLMALSWRLLRPHLAPWRGDLLDAGALARMLAIGMPIGAQMMLEYGVFAIAGVMMGWIGTTALAGHQVALNLASLTFMVPLGVSSAAAVLVGSAVGRGDMAEARRAAGAAFVGGVSFMAVSATVMLLVPGFFARLYSNDAAVVAVAASLIPIAGVFQVFDGLQVVAIGVLRGVADTRAPMLINILGFWLMGLPVSWWLGVRQRQGPAGLWWGLTFGLIVVAAMLALRTRVKLGGEVRRVLIDRDGNPHGV